MSQRPEEILTLSGVVMDPFAPRPEQIRLEDIAHALSLLTRANGHFRRFYSVGQHSLNCAREAEARGHSARVQLYCLLHDASECYLSDLTRPVKLRFPFYYEAEAGLQRVIFAALGPGDPTEDEWRTVGDIDDAMLYQEFLLLRGVALTEAPPALVGSCDFETCEMQAVERDFSARYHELAARVKREARH